MQIINALHFLIMPAGEQILVEKIASGKALAAVSSSLA